LTPSTSWAMMREDRAGSRLAELERGGVPRTASL
jgi:hypothetical protein